jgi:3-methyladenine DNA glycosylase/8-oxoguanine DNA glycosylase
LELIEQSILIQTPEGFDFWLTTRGSGWSVLAPFSIDEEERTLSRVLRLESGEVVRATIGQEEGNDLIVRVESREELDGADLKEVKSVVGTCLMLDEDLSPFYSMLESYPEFIWVAEIGAGRSVRCPTVFEDIVKTICTTNASWALTKGMTRRLCERLGDTYSEDSHSFPTPHQLAASTEEFMRAEVKSGYRSPYLVELARKIVEGELDVEAWKGSPLDSARLKKEVLKIKGVGQFAADNIMKLLGRYDFLALDSWMRRRFTEIHGEGRDVPDAEIEEHYVPFGEWKGLVLQLDASKEFLISRKR